MLFLVGWFMNGIRHILAWLCEFCYNWIAKVYALFMYISEVRILSSDTVVGIYNRITAILSIVMTFYITFEFVKYVVEPESLTDSKKGAANVLKRCFLCVVLLAFVPTIFNTAYKIQNSVLRGNVFSILIQQKKYNGSSDYESLGRNFSSNILGMFYQVDSVTAEKASKTVDTLGCEEVKYCKTIIDYNLNNLRNTGELYDLGLGIEDSTKVTIDVGGEKEKVKRYNIDFNGLLAVGVGIFILYIFLIYCIETAIRVFQMSYLQIIAPIPIISYISPKEDGMFKKWTQQCITTYLDLFIRLAIIYFILLVVETITESYNTGSLLNNVNEDLKIPIYIFLILGLLLFAKKAPKLITELFPSMGSAAAKGNFGLTGSDSARIVAKAAAGTLGSVNKGLRKAIGASANARKRNRAIRDNLKAAGKDYSRKAVRQERQQARKDERFARRNAFKADVKRGISNLATTKERNALLAAEKKVREANRGGDAEKKEAANKAKVAAEAKLEAKQAEFAMRTAGKGIANGKGIAKAHIDNREAYLGAQDKMDARKRDLDSAQAKYNSAVASDATIASARIAQADAQQNINRNREMVENSAKEKSQREAEFKTATEEKTNADKALTTAESDLEKAQKVGDAKVGELEKRLAAANANGDTEEAAKITEEIVKTKKEREDNITAAQAKLDTAHIAWNEAEKKYNSSQGAYLAAEKAHSIAIATQEKEDAEANARMANAKRSQDNREKDLMEQEGYTAAAIAYAASQKEFETARGNYESTKQTVDENKDKARQDYIEKQQEYLQKQSEYAAAANNSYSSPFGVVEGEWGALTGKITGFVQGASKTKDANITSILKATHETGQIAKKELAKEEKYLDTGGSNVLIDRVTGGLRSVVQQDLGTMTNSQVTAMTTRNYESQIASNKRTSAIESAVKASTDSAKDRSMSKISAGEQKTIFRDASALTYKDASGKAHNLEEDYEGNTTMKALFDGTHTTSEIYQALNNEATTARSSATAKRQAVENAGAAATAEQRKDAEDAANNATKLEQLLTQKQKALADYAMTDILGKTKSERLSDKSLDQVLVQKVEEALFKVEEARKNPDTYKSMLTQLSDNPTALNAFISGIITDYATLDAIQVALTTISGRRQLETTRLENLNSAAKESYKNSADKAIEDMTGSGNK